MSEGRFRVLIIDSRANSYVEDPGIETGILDDIADVELLKLNNHHELKGKVEAADAVISWHLIPLPAEALALLAENCKVIVRAAVGYDNIDIGAAAEMGIPVCNVPDYGTEEVADHAFSMILSLSRRLGHLDRRVKAGTWDWRMVGNLTRMRGMELGIIGFGRIGSAVARRARAFGLEISFFDPYVPDGTDKSHGVKRYESLHELIEGSDIISLHTLLTEETRHILGEKEFSLMKPGVILVNTSRGECIDQEALLEAFREKRISKLGLDVLEGEPSVPEELCGSDDVILTAHSAFYCDEGLAELRRKSAMAVRRGLLNRPLRSVLNGVYGNGKIARV